MWGDYRNGNGLLEFIVVLIVEHEASLVLYFGIALLKYEKSLRSEKGNIYRGLRFGSLLGPMKINKTGRKNIWIRVVPVTRSHG